MLATSSFLTPTTTVLPHGFLPTIPSPLSPRSANIYGHPRRGGAGFMSTIDDNDENVQEKENGIGNGDVRAIPFSKRPVKKAPSPKQDELKERRRGIFLKKVREGREDRRFEVRGEDIMRLDFVRRQRAWEAEQAREAPLIPSDPIEEDEDVYDLPSSNAMQVSAPPSQQFPMQEDDQVDELLQREEEELEALLSFMPGQSDGGEEEMVQANSYLDHFWSDDDDYDALCSQLVEQDAIGDQERQSQGQGQGQGQVPPPSQDKDAMDMS